MTDLKALRREISERLDHDLNSRKSFDDDSIAHIESALLQYAEAVLSEPSEEMIDSKDGYTNRTIWIAMASQRLKEIK